MPTTADNTAQAHKQYKKIQLGSFVTSTTLPLNITIPSSINKHVDD
jgi:hypothetical protein